MLKRAIPSRRHLLLGGAAFLGVTSLAGCGRSDGTPWYRPVIEKDEDANLFVQRLLLSDQKLAPEFAETDLSPVFKPNGSVDPTDKHYRALVKDGFKSYRLGIGGMVERPQSLSLEQLRQMASRTQITRHDCVEGWSCIGKWAGVPLSALLTQAGLKPGARYVVFRCFDTMDDGGFSGLDDSDDDQPKGSPDAKQAGSKTGSKAGSEGGGQTTEAATDGGKQAQEAVGNHYYESIDLVDAFHPQTILAYDMNGDVLPVPHGAPLRLRLERALGYKMAKYIARIDVTDDLTRIGQGKGGYWEDQGYEWYAGI